MYVFRLIRTFSTNLHCWIIFDQMIILMQLPFYDLFSKTAQITVKNVRFQAEMSAFHKLAQLDYF